VEPVLPVSAERKESLVIRAIWTRLPSPAFAISVIALVLAVGGGSFALAISENKSDKKVAKKVANKQITKRARTLSVRHAQSADTATTADSANSLPAPEAVHEVGAPGEPPFENGSSDAVGFAPPGFYKDRECRVHLVGAADGGSGTTVFTLPPADRPPATTLEAIAAKVVTARPGYLVVTDAGEVQPSADASGEYVFGFEGVSFRAATC
jgi:hypothetical protein